MVARYVAYWNAASHTTGSSINMTSHWSSDLVRDVSATSNRKNYVQWLKYVGVNFFSPNIKSGSTNFYHFLPAEKDVENELISKWTQKISCHYTSLIKGMVHGVFSLPFQKNFSSLQKKKIHKTLYLLPITLHYSFSRTLAIMNLLSVSGVVCSTHFVWGIYNISLNYSVFYVL